MNIIRGNLADDALSGIKREAFSRLVAPTLVSANHRIERLLDAPFILLADLHYRYDDVYPLGAMPAMERFSDLDDPTATAAHVIAFLSSRGRDEVVLEHSHGKGVSEKKQCRWHAVPWPRLVASLLGAYSRQSRRARIKHAFAYDGSLSSYLAYAAALNRVTQIREQDKQPTEYAHVGRRSLRIFEATRVNGIPQSLALAMRMLIDEGYIKVNGNFRDADGTLVDYVIPIGKMLEKIYANRATRAAAARATA